MLTCSGPTRRRYQRQEGGVPPAAEAPSNDFSIGSEPKDPEALTARLSDDISELGSSTILRGTAGDEAPEPAVLEGLFLAQRARIPVAVAVCEDYGGIPFSLPQPFVVLGWFWVTDSWTVPAGGRDMVSWLFQFEWCSKPTDDLEKPWWSTSAGNGTSYAEATEGAPWPVRGPGISGSVTLRGGQRPEQKFTNAGLQELVSDQETVLVCSRCNTMSEAVYEDIAPCLNERCDYFFKDVRQATHAPQCDPTVCPGQVRERTRLLPRQLGLDIVGTAANARFSDVERHDAQAAKWRAWVCRGCRCANERRDWFGFVCEGCALVDKPEAKVYTAAALAPPNRMVLGAAPRQAAGIASWSGHFDQREAQHPAGLAVHYKLAAGGAPSVTQILPNGEARAQYDAALELLQQQTGDVPLARQFLSATSARVPELALCAFYTAAWGTQQPPYVAHLPTSQARPWTETPEQLLKLFDTVSRRQDRPVSVTVVAVPGRLQRHSVPVSSDAWTYS